MAEIQGTAGAGGLIGADPRYARDLAADVVADCRRDQERVNFLSNIRPNLTLILEYCYLWIFSIWRFSCI